MERCHPAPTLYHAHHSRHLEDINFWTEIARHSGGPLLELGCGTGRVLLALTDIIAKIYGLDRDPGMLAVLKSQLAQRSESGVQLIQADLTAYHLALNFKLVLLPCNTYSTLDRFQRIAALQRAHQHLHDGGLFAFSIPNPSLLRALPPRSALEVEETFPHPVDQEPVQVSSGWERQGDNFTIHWVYDHLAPDGQVQRYTLDILHQVIAYPQIISEITAAGLHVIRTYGDFDSSPYTADSPYLILVAQKPAI